MKNSENKDTIYAHPHEKVSSFVFDKAVVDVFPDMIKRSVPGYLTVLAMTGMFASRYVQPESQCYDLGCSLGAATLAMGRGTENKACSIIAVDNAPAMIENCRLHIKEAGLSTLIDLRCEDIRTVVIHNASVVVLNYTLQFITPDERLQLLKNIYDGLLPGGILLLSEKISFTDPQEQHLMTTLHLDFKRANGYSDLEISQKRTALDNVLIPETLDSHHMRLKKAGFASTSVWFQCLNFASLIAIKRGESTP